MKPAFALPLAMALLAGALAGCGQPGPLYLPKQQKPAGAANVPTPVLPSTTESPSDSSTTGRSATNTLPIPVPPSPAPTQQ